MSELPKVNWGELIEQFSGGTSPVLFLKGRARVRLWPFEDPEEIFYPVQTYYRGNERTKYITKIYNLDDEERPVRALLLTKTIIRSILQLAAEGWDLFSKEEGHGLVLVKTGQGIHTSVNLSPSPKPIPIPDEVYDEDDLDMVKTAEDFSERQKDRDQQKSQDKEESSKIEGNDDGEDEDW